MLSFSLPELTSLQISTSMYLGLFLGVLLIFEGLRRGLNDGDKAKSRRRRMLDSGASRAQVLNLLRTPSNAGFFGKFMIVRAIRNRMHQAGLTFRPWILVLSCVALSAVIFLFLRQRESLSIASMISVAIAVMLPCVIISIVRRRRLDKFVAQMPDALDLMARGLRVGHPLNTSLASVAEEMPDPIGTEFGIVVDQVTYGDDIVVAFRELSERLDIDDLYYLASAIGIQASSGGNLARVLAVMSKVIRDRAMMRKRIKAISSEGRLSALILSVIAPGMYGLIQWTSPSFYDEVKSDPMFIPLMATAAGLVIANGIILHQLVNFRH